MKNPRRAYAQILPSETHHGLNENRRQYLNSRINDDDNAAGTNDYYYSVPPHMKAGIIVESGKSSP